MWCVRLLLLVQKMPESVSYLQVVGSPANWWTHVQSWSIRMNLNVQPSTSPNFMTEEVWTELIGPEVLKQCDAMDGVRPSAIHRQASPLTCLLPADRRNR